MPKPNKRQVIILILLIAILYVLTEVIPLFVKEATSTTVIESGTLTISDEQEGYIIRDESVYNASSGSDISYKVKEGTLIKQGTKVLEISENNKSDEKLDEISKRTSKFATSDGIETSQRKGVFSTYVDGYENYFTYDNYNNITLKKCREYENSVEDIKADAVSKNQTLYKIADQSCWYIVTWIDGIHKSRYSENQVVNVKVNSKEIEFVIEKIETKGSKIKVLLASNKYYKDFAKYRNVPIEVFTTKVEGLMIDNSSIAKKDGNIGLYVVSTTGEKNFVRIKTMATDGKKSIIAEGQFYDDAGKQVTTVNMFDEIVKKP